MNTGDYQNWANAEWNVQMANNQFVNSGDKLYFTEFMTIEVLKSGETDPTVWGKDCEVTSNGLYGITDADGTPFVVEQLANGQLRCSYVDTSFQVAKNAGLSGLLGAGIGFAIGAATGNPLAGAVTGAAAGVGGSLLTSVLIKSSSGDSTNAGSSATWIAQDGQSGGQQTPLMQAVGA